MQFVLYLYFKWISSSSWHSVNFSWFKDTAVIFSPIILVQLTTSMLFLSCAVFEIDLVIALFLNLNIDYWKNYFFLLWKWTSIRFSYKIVLIFSRNSDTSTSISFSYSLSCVLACRICLSFAITANWQPKAMPKCPPVCLNAIGEIFRWKIKNISSSWSEMLSCRYTIMDLKLPFWTWKRLRK